MKYLHLFLSIVAISLIGYNATFIDFSDLSSEKSIIAMIGICACLCALTLIGLLYSSRKIAQKIKSKQK